MKKFLTILLLINQFFKNDVVAQQIQSPLEISFREVS